MPSLQGFTVYVAFVQNLGALAETETFWVTKGRRLRIRCQFFHNNHSFGASCNDKSTFFANDKIYNFKTRA